MIVIFDLGNVVLDWNTEVIVKNLELSTEQQIALKNQLFDHEDWLKLDCGMLSEAEAIVQICHRSELTENILERALVAAKESLVPIYESLNLLQDIHREGIPLYCLSNMSVETFNYLESKMDFFKLFDGMTISGIEKCMKPDSNIFNILLSRYKLQASECLFIDDSLSNVEAARNIGFNTHLFRRSEACYQCIRELVL